MDNPHDPGQEGPAGQGTGPGDEKLIPWLKARPKQVSAAAVTMLTIMIAIAAIIAIDTPAGKIIGGIFFVVVAVSGFGANRLWGHVNSRQVGLDIVSAVVLAVATGVLVWAAAPTRDVYIVRNITTPKPTVTIIASPTASVAGKQSNIYIISPRNADRVPQCSIIQGSGSIPVGYTLWIMYSLNDGHAPYWFGAAAVADSTSPSDWSTTSTVGIGDSSPASIGISAELIPVLIRDPWGSFLASKDTDGEREVRSAQLPPDSIVLPPDRRVTVTRSAELGACSAS